MNLGAVSTLVFDLDGVVWRGDTPIDSAITAINALRAAGKRCLFCTNNSSQTQATFVAKLASMGIEGLAEEEILTSSSATALYLSAQYTGPFLAYVVGGEGIRQAIQKIGARIVPDSDITEESNVDCVVAGIDREFDYAKLNIAQRLIRRGALFVATNRDATYPTEDGVIPGAGSIVSAIETAAGTTPVTIGKPRPVMLQLIMQQYGLQPEQLAFIGDRLDTDVVCARRAGVAALLVTTGVTTLQQARRAKGEMRPDAVFPNLTSFAEVMLEGASATAINNEELTNVSAAVAAAPFAAVAAEPVVTSSIEPEEAVEEVAEETDEVVPESAPMVVEAPAEELEAVQVEETVSEGMTPELSAFSFDTALAKDDAEIDEVVIELDDSAEATGSEFDENWFEENAPAEDAIEIVEPATPEAEEVEPGKESADDGFNWKLD
jgi:phosphoglycolate/pyridoxal phosphate phosphatase family enzyme